MFLISFFLRHCCTKSSLTVTEATILNHAFRSLNPSNHCHIDDDIRFSRSRCVNHYHTINSQSSGICYIDTGTDDDITTPPSTTPLGRGNTEGRVLHVGSNVYPKVAG